MPVPVVTSVTVTDQHAGPDTTLVVNMPDERPDNDIYVAICFKDDDPEWSLIPGSWNEILSSFNNQERLMAWWFLGSGSYGLAWLHFAFLTRKYKNFLPEWDIGLAKSPVGF